ncbi:MAG: hypothetical protein RLZZ399_2245 [Verrucomicrobiota bacterium]|jgi:hypothetical protein
MKSSDPLENDRLWELLDQAPPAVLPPDFTSRVVSSVEAFELGLRERDSEKRISRNIWKPLAGALALVLLSLALWPGIPSREQLEEDLLLSTLSNHELVPSDLLVVARLNELLEAEIASLWTGNQ